MKITLGIDIGTTKCAAVLLDHEKQELLEISSEAHKADLKTIEGHSEQDPALLLKSVIKIINQLPSDLRNQVAAIGVTGQMHSVMGWNENEIFPLITWQDRRCGLDGKLEEFRQKSGYDLHDGYGAATLAWLGKETDARAHAATIMDYLTMRLCGNHAPVTDASNAASWGIFDLQKNQWDSSAANALGIPERLLPELKKTGETVGCLSKEWSEILGLPAGIPVINAIGDNQASVFGTGKDFGQELYLTLGTGAQLSTVISEAEFQTLSPKGKLEIRPFDNTRKLAVCSALCGGRAFAWIGDMVNEILKELGCREFAQGELLDRIDFLSEQTLNQGNPALKVTPSFLGERNDPERKGSISGLTLTNFSLGALGAAAAEGILENLISEFPPELLKKRTLVLGSGNGIRKVKTIQQMIRKKFTQQFILTSTREEACCGAAVLAGNKIWGF